MVSLAHLCLRENSIIKKVFTDNEIIEVLLHQPKLELEVLKYVYAAADPSLRKFILSNGGDNTIADDIIQDAIIVCYEKIKNGKFKLQTTLIGYIYTVGKYIWYNRQRKEKPIVKVVSTDAYQLNTSFEENDFELFNVDKTALVDELLAEVGSSCKKILIESIYMKKSMQEIAKSNDLKNEQVARNKKSKCLKKLRKIIEASSYFKNIFKHIEL